MSLILSKDLYWHVTFPVRLVTGPRSWSSRPASHH